MAQGPSDTILVGIQITLRIRESKVRNPDPPDWRRFVFSECFSCFLCFCLAYRFGILSPCFGVSLGRFVLLTPPGEYD